MKRERGIAVSLAVSLLLTGCATVEPRSDYVRVTERVQQATGMGEMYLPGEEERIAAQLDELFTDGLTVDEAVSVAMLNNPSLQAAFFDVGIARADVVQAGLFSNPSLGLTMRFPDAGGLANLEAGLAQNIAELWQIPVRTEAAERSLDAAILDVARRGTRLAADTKRAYYAAVQAAELEKVVEQNLDVARRLETLAKEQLEAGAAGQLEVNLASGAVVEAELQAESARLATDNARRALAALLGVPARASELGLTDALPAAPQQTPREDELVEIALRSRLDVAAAEELVRAAEARVRMEHRRVFPNVEVGIGLERSERRAFPGRRLLADTARASIRQGQLAAPEITSRAQRQQAKGQEIETIIGPSLSLELPIFDQNQAQIARAEYAHEQAIKTLVAVERALIGEVHGVFDQAETHWRLVRMYRERSLPLAQHNLELSEEAYRLGRASFLSVLEAQRFLLSSRRSYVNALGKAASTLPALEQAVGRPLADVVTSTQQEDES